MRLFLTVCSMLALSHAKPQGYNYVNSLSGPLSGLSLGNALGSAQGNYVAAPSPQQLSANFVGHAGGHNGHTGHIAHNAATFGALSNFAGNANSNGFNTLAQPTANFGFQTLANNNYQQQQLQQQQQQQQQTGKFEAPLVHKQFYTITAQEDADSTERTKHLVIGRPQKNYRVVFIKAPSSSNANLKLSAEYAPQEEKTVIYVLSKKDSSLEVNDIATPAPIQPSKPEVFFIKYKTEQEAQLAQRQIQAEYDKIEGTSEHNDGGIAPQQSVIGILDANGNTAASNTITTTNDGGFAAGNIAQGGANIGSATNLVNVGGNTSTYLPPARV